MALLMQTRDIASSYTTSKPLLLICVVLILKTLGATGTSWPLFASFLVILSFVEVLGPSSDFIFSNHRFREEHIFVEEIRPSLCEG